MNHNEFLTELSGEEAILTSGRGYSNEGGVG
jgi:hypothetical protein